MSVSTPPDSVGAPKLISLSPEMTRDERSRALRALTEEVRKARESFPTDPVEISVIAQRANEALKGAKGITHEQLAEIRARADEFNRNNKVLLELHTDQGRITIDHSGISSDNPVILATVREALNAKRKSGELPEPADVSEKLSQLVEVAKSLYGKDAEISKLPEPELQLSNALGAVTLLSDGSITATGGMAAVIAGLFQPGNALSAQPSDRLHEIITRRIAVLQSLFATG
jgi:hypothetical protein